MLEPQPIGPAASEAPRTRTNVVWRFFVDQDGGWRWQQLGSDSALLSESSGSSATYDDCVGDAQVHGYRYARSQEKVGQPPRTYTFPDNWR